MLQLENNPRGLDIVSITKTILGAEVEDFEQELVKVMPNAR